MSDEMIKKDPILIAEDDLTSRMIMTKFIQNLNYTPVAVADGRQAWEVLSGENPPALALVDWEMPEMDGLELVHKVRSELKDRFFYLIMVTGKNTKEEIVTGIGEGADDYVIKPFDSKELEVRIRAGQRIMSLHQELVAVNKKLEEMAQTDALTGFYNKHALYRDLKERFNIGSFTPPSMSFIMADIDHFKRVNDTYGHDAGDLVLKQFAERVKLLLRKSDVVFRVGGEEFLLIAPGTDTEEGRVIAERVRGVMEKTPFKLPDGGQLPITCSLGICNVVLDEIKEDLDAIIKRADQALYASKQNGRNRVTVCTGCK